MSAETYRKRGRILGPLLMFCGVLIGVPEAYRHHWGMVAIQSAFFGFGLWRTWFSLQRPKP